MNQSSVERIRCPKCWGLGTLPKKPPTTLKSALHAIGGLFFMVGGAIWLLILSGQLFGFMHYIFGGN